jgi:hypothetical protein
LHGPAQTQAVRCVASTVPDVRRQGRSSPVRRRDNVCLLALRAMAGMSLGKLAAAGRARLPFLRRGPLLELFEEIHRLPRLRAPCYGFLAFLV